MSDTPLVPEHEAAIRARLAAISGTNWRMRARQPGNQYWTAILCDIFEIKGLVMAVVRDHRPVNILHPFEVSEPNAEFIAAAPDDVRVLLAEVERLRAEMRAASEELKGSYFGRAVERVRGWP